MGRRRNNHRTADSDAYLEQVVIRKLLAKKGYQRPDSQVCIFVHSKRHRLADPDGISAKAAIDGLVRSGILEDDSAKFIKEVSFTQEKIPSKEKETTIITIRKV